MKPPDEARWQGVVNSWLAQGCVTDITAAPGNNVVLVDTGQLTRGWHDFTIITNSSAAHNHAEIQHRNSVNDANLHSWVFGRIAYGLDTILITNWYIDSNERLRIVNVGASAALMYSNIHWTKRA